LARGSGGKFYNELKKISSYTLFKLINNFRSATTIKTPLHEKGFEQEPFFVHEVTCHINQTIITMSTESEVCREFLPWLNLKELSLSVDLLSYIDWMLFETFPNLEKLEIRPNSLCDPGNFDLRSVFENGQNLKSLKIRLKVNKMDCIQELARCFPRLEELDLSDSENMRDIGPNDFSNFPNLKKLSLSGCSIKTIDRQAFSHLLNLNELDISGNKSLTMFQMKSSLVLRVLKVNGCTNLSTVKFDSDSSSLSAIDELVLPSGTALECSPCLFVNTRVLVITPMCGMSFDSFAGLERLTLAIDRFDDVKRGQLASLMRLKELHLYCNSSNKDGLCFFFFFIKCRKCKTSSPVPNLKIIS
jgi:Leucine-rich repeat (LRR) protein